MQPAAAAQSHALARPAPPSLAAPQAHERGATPQRAAVPLPAVNAALVLHAVTAEAEQRDAWPAPSIPGREAALAANRANELVRAGLFSEPKRAAQALVHAAFELALGPKQRPLRFALLEATVSRGTTRSRAQQNYVPPEDPWV